MLYFSRSHLQCAGTPKEHRNGSWWHHVTFHVDKRRFPPINVTVSHFPRVFAFSERLSTRGLIIQGGVCLNVSKSQCSVKGRLYVSGKANGRFLCVPSKTCLSRRCIFFFPLWLQLKVVTVPLPVSRCTAVWESHSFTATNTSCHIFPAICANPGIPQIMCSREQQDYYFNFTRRFNNCSKYSVLLTPTDWHHFLLQMTRRH